MELWNTFSIAASSISFNFRRKYSQFRTSLQMTSKIFGVQSIHESNLISELTFYMYPHRWVALRLQHFRKDFESLLKHDKITAIVDGLLFVYIFNSVCSLFGRKASSIFFVHSLSWCLVFSFIPLIVWNEYL